MDNTADFKKILERLEHAGIKKVKVAVADMDGVLRGKRYRRAEVQRLARRHLLSTGMGGLLGLSLPNLLRADAERAKTEIGRAHV